MRLNQVPRHAGGTDGFLDIFVTSEFLLVVLLPERQLSEEPKQRILTVALRTCEATPSPKSEALVTTPHTSLMRLTLLVGLEVPGWPQQHSCSGRWGTAQSKWSLHQDRSTERQGDRVTHYSPNLQWCARPSRTAGRCPKAQCRADQC